MVGNSIKVALPAASHGCPVVEERFKLFSQLAGLRNVQEVINNFTSCLFFTLYGVVPRVRIAKVLVKPLTTLRLRGPSEWVHPGS